MKRTWLVLTLIIIALWSLAPFLWQALTSLKPDTELTRLPPLLPATLTIDHYRSVFTGAPFLRIIANSVIVASCSTALSIAIGSFAAFGLAKLNVRLKGLILMFALSSSMFPPIAIVSPLYIIIRALGLRDTWWALIITYTTFTLPLSIWILTNFFREIPDEIYRAGSATKI